MQYDWYKKEVKQKLRDLLILQMHQDTPAVRQAIRACENFVCYKEPPHKELSEREIFLSEYYTFKKYQMIWHDLAEFAKKSSQKIELEKNKINISFSEEEMFELTHDFFKKGTNQTFYRNFMHFYNERRKYTHIISKGPDYLYGESFFLPLFNKHYIQIKPIQEFGDVSTLVHEYGHGIQFLNNYSNHLFSKNEMFIEIISTFFEFISLIYFSHNGSYQEYALSTLVNCWEELKYASQNIKTLLDYFNLMELDKCSRKEEVIRNVNEYINSFGQTNIKQLTQNDGAISSNIVYVFAMSIVCELLNMYYEDPDKALSYAFNILCINPNLPQDLYYEAILDLGIIPNEGFSQFENHLKRELKLN